jgi:hypothetical protein
VAACVILAGRISGDVGYNMITIHVGYNMITIHVRGWNPTPAQASESLVR